MEGKKELRGSEGGMREKTKWWKKRRKEREEKEKNVQLL